MGGASALRPVTPGAMLNGSWTLSLGGLTAARMEIDGTSDAGRYAVEASIQTAGVVRPFWKAGIDAEVEGAVTALARHGGLAPRRYRAKSSDADLTRHIAIDYPAQRPRVKIEPAYDKRRWALDPSNQTDALDPLSAMLSAFGDQPVEALCGREIRVFDARRLYAVTLEPATATPDAATITCGAAYRRLGGFKPKMLARPPYPFRVTFTKAASGLWQLERAEGDTPYGTAVLARERPDG